MKNRRNRRSARAMPRLASPRGIVLIDALIAVVIFSIGIVGMVSLLGTASKLSGDAQYRTNAAMFADQVVSLMWTDATTSLVNDFSSPGGAQFKLWSQTIDCASPTRGTGCLPGSASYPPTIKITAVPNSPSDFLVTVTVNWRAPNDLGPHNYVSTTQIGP
ncbi:MAG: hypothetical protein KGM46_04405 [Pseudomonadota bacterium]|nr:hypothetical protein [Pseudomonadota bacterium]